MQGNWVGTYGADGYVLANWNGNNSDLASLPAGVTYALELGLRATWAASTTEVRALTGPTGTGRKAATFYDVNTFRLRMTFPNGYTGTLHLYALDWDMWQGNRYQTVSINDGHGLQTANLSSSYYQGAWIHAPITVSPGGSVVITGVRTGGNTAVLAGLFLGGAAQPMPTPTPTPTPTTDSDTHANPDPIADAKPDPIADPNPIADAHADATPDADAHADARPRRRRRPHANARPRRRRPRRPRPQARPRPRPRRPRRPRRQRRSPCRLRPDQCRRHPTPRRGST